MESEHRLDRAGGSPASVAVRWFGAFLAPPAPVTEMRGRSGADGDIGRSVSRRVAAVSVGWLGISMVADGVPAVLLPHQLLSAGDGAATTLGLVSLLALAAGAAAQPPAGRLSDAIGRWPIVAAGVGMAVAGLLLLVSAAALPGAVLAMVGVSVAQAGYQPLLPDVIPGRTRGAASGWKSAADVAGATIGFLMLAALLEDGASIAATAVLAGALVVPFAIAYGLLRGGDAVRRPPTRRVDIGQLFSGVPSSLVALAVARFFFLLGIFAVGRFLLLFVGDRLNLSPDAAAAQAGVALGLLALVTLIASVPAGWLADRLGRRGLLVAGGIIAALGIALLPTAGSVGMVLAFGSLMAVGSAAFSAASWAALTDLAPSADAGRLLGLANVGTAGAASAAGGFGLLIDAGNAGGGELGYTLAFGLSAVAALIGGSLAWRSVPPAAAIGSARFAEVPR